MTCPQIIVYMLFFVRELCYYYSLGGVTDFVVGEYVVGAPDG